MYKRSFMLYIYIHTYIGTYTWDTYITNNNHIYNNGLNLYSFNNNSLL